MLTRLGSDYRKSQSGSSVIEVMIAMAIFIIIAASSVVTILGSFTTTRLAKEETLATLFAQEGLEAVQSIRNQAWSNLVVGTYGLENSGGNWIFAGSPDLDPSGKFTREAVIVAVERDTGGDIVSSGGIVDNDTVQVTVNVNWSFTPTRQNTVTLDTYLTDWQHGQGSGSGGGGGTTTCSQYCLGLSYSGGTCRQNSQQCSNNSEVHESGGDILCTGGASADTCCCVP